MADATPALRARTIRGFVLIAGQRCVALVVTAVGGIGLARLLTPEVFGVYGIISFAVGLGVTFGDVGLGAALVQRREATTKDALTVAFTAHMSFATVLAAALVGFAPSIVAGFSLGAEAVAPLRYLACLIPLAALRMPSVVVLERELRYRHVALSDAVDTVVYYIVAVAAALGGAGIWSFVIGAISARSAALYVLWRETGWRPRCSWSWPTLAPIVRFGLWFQGSTLLNVVRDAVLPTFVAASCGVAAVGFLSWASAVAFLPLQIVSIAGRVLFPALSQLQDSPAEFALAMERALNRVTLLLYPAALFLLVGTEGIIRPLYGQRWMPAIPAIQFFCIAAILGGTSTLLTHGLYALGRAGTVFRLNLLWTALIWALTLVLVPRWSFVGFALASACVSVTGVLSFWTLRQSIPLRIATPTKIPLAAAVPSALLFFMLAHWWIDGVLSLIIGGIVASGTYAGLLYLLGGAPWRAELLADWRRMRERWDERQPE